MPEGEGREIESARNQGKVSIVAAVTPSGRAAIKRLLLDGKPVYDEPMFYAHVGAVKTRVRSAACPIRPRATPASIT